MALSIPLALFLLSPSSGSDESPSGDAAATEATRELQREAQPLDAELPTEPAREEDRSRLLTLRAADPRGGADARFFVRERGRVRVLDGEEGRVSLPREGEGFEVAVLSGGAWSPLRSITAGQRRESQEILLTPTDLAASLEAAVRMEDGSPVEEFQFRVRWTGPLRGETQQQARRGPLYTHGSGRQSGSGGRFELDGIPPGKYSVSVQSDHAARQVKNVELRPSARELLDFRLVVGAFVEGTVVAADDSPLDEAEVYLFPPDGLTTFFDGELTEGLSALSIPGGQGESDDDGRFRIGPVPAGEYLLYADSDGYLPHRGVEELKLLAGQTTDAGILRLSPGLALEVEVVAAEDGAPIEGARVRYYPGARSDGFFAGLFPWKDPDPDRTDDRGRLRLPSLPATTITILAEAEGRASLGAEVAVEDLRDGVYRLALGLERTLRGRVISRRDGTPVGDAQILARPSDKVDFLSGLIQDMPSDAGNPKAETGDDGGFELRGMAPGAWNLIVRAEEFASQAAGPFEIPPDQEPAEVLIELSTGARLQVVVLDEDGEPTPGAYVSVFSFGAGDTSVQETDEDGRTVFDHLTPSMYQVQAIPPGIESQAAGLLTGDFSGFSSQMEFLELEEDEERELVLGGRVLRSDVIGFVTQGGVPKADLTVMLYSSSLFTNARTDDEGFYEFEGVPEGNYMVMIGQFQMGSGAGWYGDLVVPGGEVVQRDVELPGTSVRVTVTDRDSGEPLAGIPVLLRLKDNNQGGGFLNTGADGEVVFEYIRPGEFVLSVGRASMPLFGRGQDQGTVLVENVVVSEMQHSELHYPVSLPRAATLEARVVDAGGQPVVGAGVFYLDEKGQPITYFSMDETNADGVVTVSSLPPGSGRVVAKKAGYGQIEQEVWLTSGEETRTELRLEGGTLVRVLVVDEEGQPIPGVQAIAVDSRGSPISTLMAGTDAIQMGMSFLSGTEQRLGPLAPGNYTLHLNTLGGQQDRHELVVEPGTPEMRLTLEFKP